MTLDDLLAPVSDEAPGGEDLFDHPDRQQIEQAFEEGADAVDWRGTVALIEEQSRQTKDIWLAIYLARAGARMGRIDVVATGCAMLAGLMELYWDVLHPSLEDYGFIGRRGACESLARIGTFLGPLRRIALVEHPRLGSYTAEDLERFEAEGDAAEGFGMFRRVIEEIEPGVLEEKMATLLLVRGAIERVDQALMAHAGSETGTDFKPTYQAIDAIRRLLAPYVKVDAGQGEGAPIAAGDAPEQAVARGVGRLESREDVARAIDAISDYYARREPSSPILVGLRRVRGWIHMDFMALLEDIAPNSVSEAGSVLLTRTSSESSDY
ncbi:type VI secretion system ImpA family N-terminal domain-containing protein [Novosphingobium sp.]|uniref:type VI secretion system protein TssA n=1 Tax=Novosphingobium sp. TaxID=1874826 RepID=UPI0031D270A0